MNNFKVCFLLLLLTNICLLGCQKPPTKTEENFNLNWGFYLANGTEQALHNNPNAVSWESVRLPHDWSAESKFSTENTGSSTGFLPGGIGWYKKEFNLTSRDKEKVIAVEFDGVYNNAEVWINGNYLGKRPYGYISFGYELTPYLNYGESPNLLVVKVDHSNYLDSRWYTGSGIYRDVRLTKKEKIHFPKWAIGITTPAISNESADIIVDVAVNNFEKGAKDIVVKGEIFSMDGQSIATTEEKAKVNQQGNVTLHFTVANPRRWDIEDPYLYKANVSILKENRDIDSEEVKFGIRTFKFDANQGFYLNGKNRKLKGVNLHHAAGAVGAAVPIDVWARRFIKLKEIGCNAIRTAHNPVDPQFLDLCDQMGFVVIDEFFDEWNIPKKKSLHKLGDNLAPDEVTHGYTEEFDEWYERDLSDCIKRDRNHPSVIMWSIGNEIEWTHPYYSQAYEAVNGKQEYYLYHPTFDSLKIKTAFDKITGGKDSLLVIAKKLSTLVKSLDPTRPVTCGNVLPSVGLATGYGQSVDVLGFNYRATEYDGAHEAYPNLLIYGSENWGAWSEWKACVERDFVAGIFCWTGFAYGGESGPWPHKGLNISFFDFAGFKTARGHFFQALWKDEPHIYMGTTAEEESEYSYDVESGFSVELKKEWIRRWDWYDIYDKWQYAPNEEVIVQVYSNCEENELFLNGKSQGRKKTSDFEDDNVVKWMVPFQAGELKVVGLNNNQEVTSYSLHTTEKIDQIALTSDKTTLRPNNKDVIHIEARLKDANGHLISHDPMKVTFDVKGDVTLLGIDNGATDNVQGYKSYQCTTHNGKVLLMLQSNATEGEINVTANANGINADLKFDIVK